MKDEPLPLTIAAKLRATVDFEALSEWAEHAIQRRCLYLSEPMEECETVHVRGEIAGLRRVMRLGPLVETILQNAQNKV